MSREIVNPFEPPKVVETVPAVAVDPQEDFRARLRGDSRGRRIAGWFLIANAALSIVALFAPETTVSIFGIFLDVLVGFVLIRGYGSAANVALVRTAIGVLFAIVAAFRGNPDPIFFMIPYGAGLTLLSLGNPTRARVILGCVFFGFYLASFAAILALLMTGKL